MLLQEMEGAYAAAKEGRHAERSPQSAVQACPGSSPSRRVAPGSSENAGAGHGSMPAAAHAASSTCVQKRAAGQPLAAQQNNGEVKRRAWTQGSDDTDDLMF